jgi:hypothetical protein
MHEVNKKKLASFMQRNQSKIEEFQLRLKREQEITNNAVKAFSMLLKSRRTKTN